MGRQVVELQAQMEPRRLRGVPSPHRGVPHLTPTLIIPYPNYPQPELSQSQQYQSQLTPSPNPNAASQQRSHSDSLTEASLHGEQLTGEAAGRQA